MNRTGARLDSLGDLPPEIASHLTSCTSCLADRRVAWLRSRETATDDAAVADPQPRGRRLLLWAAALLAALAAAFWLLSPGGFFQQQP